MSNKKKTEKIASAVLEEISKEEYRSLGCQRSKLVDKMVALGFAKVAISKVINELIDKDSLVILEGEGDDSFIGIKESPPEPEPEEPEQATNEQESGETNKDSPEPEKEEPESADNSQESGKTDEPQPEPEPEEPEQATNEQESGETNKDSPEPEKEEPKKSEDDIDDSFSKQEKSIEEQRRILEEQLKQLVRDKEKVSEKRQKFKELPEGVRADFNLLKSEKTEVEIQKKELRDSIKCFDNHFDSWKRVAKGEGVSDDVIFELGKQLIGRTVENSDLEKVYSDKKGIIPDTIKALRAYPDGIKRADLIKEVCGNFGYNKGAVNRVLSETSRYVSGGTLIQRGIVILEGDRIRLSEKHL
ncbi:MAG: hypothetical protein O8C67_07190 [Candidatus Methanoperedens sp.]|nr:hypothetical protein [Candidatus Methanoperedens sp.]